MSRPTKNQIERRKAKLEAQKNSPEFCNYCLSWFLRKQMACEIEGGGWRCKECNKNGRTQYLGPRPRGEELWQQLLKDRNDQDSKGVDGSFPNMLSPS